jgi:PrtD family type I secretion system ABC transporter
MLAFIARFRKFFLFAGVFSFAINVLLIVPAIYMLQVFDRVMTSRSQETLVMLSAFAAASLLVMAALDYVRSQLLARAAVALDKILGPLVVREMLASQSQSTPSTTPYAIRDVSALRGFLAGSPLIALFDIPWIPFYIVVISLFHPLLGLVALGGAVILLGVTIANERLSREPLERMEAQSRKASTFVDLSLRNAESIAAMGMAPSILANWERHHNRVLMSQLSSSRTASRASAATKFVRQTIQVAVLGAGAYLVINLEASAGVMIAATILLGRSLAPVEGLVAGWKALVDARGAYIRLDKLLRARNQEAVVTTLPPPSGILELERVVFGFRHQPQMTIKSVSLRLPAGETLAVIGPSGSGKSTLARLIIGIWAPLGGTVRLDGADVSAWPRDELGKHVGYLPQDVELFSGTVSENIARMGTPDSAAVVAAAQRANAHEMILKLPKGYDTPIGDAGALLSGGQRQRIALARALYGTPRFVVLDEPNSNLDTEGELALLAALRELKREKSTCVVITHRPSLLETTDKVLVLRDGAIDRFGTPAEVLPQVAPKRLQPVATAAPVQAAPRREG